MGDTTIICPLCCKETFNSKHSLIEHLANILSNLICPICKDKWSTLVHLIEHLSLDNCHQTNSASGTKSKSESLAENNVESNGSTDLNVVQDNENIQKDNTECHFSNNAIVFTHQKKKYVEFVNEQVLKQNTYAKELKLVKESGDRYVIVTDDESILNTGSTVVKQNNDGTISMTVDDTAVNQPLENNDGLYSCNTCGVSFSSVMEHIQKYHNDQEVVVEERLDSANDETIEYETIDSEDLTPNDKQASRRMITETGDIVEAPVILETNDEVRQQLMEQSIIIPIKETEEKGNEPEITKCYVQIDKFSNSIVKDIKESEDKNGPYHKVVVKEMQTTLGSMVKVYNCMSCNICVSSLSEFKSHPCKPLKYPCLQCPVAYENPKSLCAHMKVHKSRSDEVNIPSPTSFECGVCSTVFPTSKSLKLHKRMHDPIKSRPIEPPVETPEGNTASEDKYICPICFKLIPEDYRTIHEESHTYPTNTMNCDICNKKFHSKEYLKMHMGVHNMEKVVVEKQDRSLPYTCVYCNRKFARPHEKVKHERIHTGEKPHACEICGKAFRVSYCLTLHMRTHTGARPYACPHCNKRFKAHSVYNHHLLTHSEVRAYKCPYCPKAFKTSVQLAGHKNSHTKPFSCQQCNRPFASLYAVRVHTEIHSRQNSLKFSCSLCGASYARAFALKDHIKQAHKDAVENLNNLKDDDWRIRGANGDDEEEEEVEIHNLNNDLPAEVIL
ncbi:zinc finger protein 271-like isoform X2 [Battus philenor]|uniref:zinc finger protein 271-like isoform X2 n=1 Tax=Battus philenor TaxID=42288 RepID=UPI0035CFF803